MPASNPLRFDYRDIVTMAARRDPAGIGLIAADESFSFAQIEERVERWARVLAARGVGPGERVALCLGNHPAWVFAFFALSRLRASAVMLSTAWRGREIEHALTVTGARRVIAGSEQTDVIDEAGDLDLALAVGPTTSPGWVCLEDVLDEDAPMLPTSWRELDPSDMELALPFSSGTTGVPKAVRHTHRSLWAATEQWQVCLGIGDDDKLQALTPLAHILGIVNVGATFMGGATIKLFPKFSPRSMVESFEQDRITIGMTVAPIAAALAAMPDLEDLDLSSLRYLNWSATPVNEDIAEQVTERTGIGWVPAYGTTEVPIIAVNPVDGERSARLDSVGIPPIDVEVEAIDPVTERFLPRGETGELVVRSPARMTGYLPESTTEPFLEGGWYRTGDIGHVEVEGWVMVTDRLKDLIKVSGFQVSPVEIENVLMMHPDVSDCAVFAMPDDRRGEVPCAAVVPVVGTTPRADELIAWLTPQLSAYKALAEVRVVEEIPRTPSGKVQRRRLVGPVGPIG